MGPQCMTSAQKGRGASKNAPNFVEGGDDVIFDVRRTLGLSDPLPLFVCKIYCLSANLVHFGPPPPSVWTSCMEASWPPLRNRVDGRQRRAPPACLTDHESTLLPSAIRSLSLQSKGGYDQIRCQECALFAIQ